MGESNQAAEMWRMRPSPLFNHFISKRSSFSIFLILSPLSRIYPPALWDNWGRETGLKAEQTPATLTPLIALKAWSLEGLVCMHTRISAGVRPRECASCFLLTNLGVTCAVLKVLLKQGVKDRTLLHCMTPWIYLFFPLGHFRSQEQGLSCVLGLHWYYGQSWGLRCSKTWHGPNKDLFQQWILSLHSSWGCNISVNKLWPEII